MTSPVHCVQTPNTSNQKVKLNQWSLTSIQHSLGESKGETEEQLGPSR